MSPLFVPKIPIARPVAIPAPTPSDELEYPQDLNHTGTPLILASDDIVVPAGMSGVMPDMGRMQSQFRTPILIDEVRFFVQFSTAGLRYPSDLIRCKMTMGRIGITRNGPADDFVPVWLFGTTANALAQVERVAGGLNTGAPVFTTYANYRWRLPQPLFVPPGSVLTPSFQNTYAADVVVTATYVARGLPGNTKTPSKIKVPLVASFVGTTGDVSKSGELDIVNPFLVPLHVQRLIGRAAYINGTTNLDAMSAASGVAAPTVRIIDSWGHSVVRDFVSMREVFDTNKRAWTFSKVLDPKERYEIYFANVAANVTPMVSMIGWREEVFS